MNEVIILIDFHEAITQTVPIDDLRKGHLEKQTWLLWVQQLEQLLTTHKLHVLHEILLPNSIIPLSIDGLYLRLIINGVRIEGVSLYEKSTSYRLCNSYNHQIVNFVIHEVHQIKGLTPTHLEVTQKTSLHA